MDPITVIGIDPGSLRTGWGVVHQESGICTLVECGIIRTTSEGNRPFCDRLAQIFHELVAVLQRIKPTEAAIEQVFQAKNAATALKLGQARGVAVAACASCGLPVHDYEPSLVKKTVTGRGGAEKEQVAFMVQRILGVRGEKWALDTSDALGIAITHLMMRRQTALLKKLARI